MSSYMPLPIGASQAAGVAPAPSMATPIVGAQEDYVYNSLLKERIIWLGSEVRDSNANLICSQMLLLSAEDPEADIYLYINSPGGSVTAGMAIYDTMQLSIHGSVPAHRGHHRQALRNPERPHPDAPAPRRYWRYRIGYPHPG